MKKVFMDEAYNLWWFLARTREILYKARQAELDRYNISARQASVMFVIQAIGNKATPAKIARLLFREPHTVSAILKNMERRGLVRKTKDLDKKNLVRVVLTDKGLEAYRKSEKRESVHKIMSALSKEKYQQLRSCLEILQEEGLAELGIERKLPFQPFEHSSSRVDPSNRVKKARARTERVG